MHREDGLLRLVVGLGTRAVDRVGDYARMVPLKAPTLRPETTPEEIQRVSQKRVDVVDLNETVFKAVPAADVLGKMRSGGALPDLVSIREEAGNLTTPVGTHVAADAEDLCITFDRLLSRGEFPKRMSSILERLEKAYAGPVDLEFAVNDDRLYILQCRPLGAGARA